MTDDNDLGDALRDRFFRPVQALGTTGDEILKTVRAFVSHQGHYERTARELYVHPNTVRYRIRRFEEVTGTELRTPPNMISAWWALERHRMLGESASD